MVNCKEIYDYVKKSDKKFNRCMTVFLHQEYLENLSAYHKRDSPFAVAGMTVRGGRSGVIT